MTNTRMRTIRHLPLINEASGISNLQAEAGRRQQRDNAHWFDGFLSGVFWGGVFCAVVVISVKVFAR